MAFAKRETCITAYNKAITELNSGIIKPVYCLMGEETYYIDKLATAVIDKILKPEERDFNLITFFGADTDASQVVNAARGFPMGAQHLVVCVREAQQMAHFDLLEGYLKHPQASTVLLLSYKYGSLDKRTKVAAMIAKMGLLFESNLLYDNQVPEFVRDYVAKKNLTIDPKAVSMLSDSVGVDLSRMAGELDKLALVATDKKVTPELVEHHIGISKEFNNFELQDALVQRNVFKVNQIAKYFDINPKKYPIQMTLPVLYKFFSNLMLAYYAPDKTEQGIAQWIGANPYVVKKSYLPAMRNYSGTKVMNIIGAIRRTDARSKGVDNPATSNGDLLKELLFFILH